MSVQWKFLLGQWERTYQVTQTQACSTLQSQVNKIVEQIAGGRGRIYRLLGSFYCASALLGRTS
jgi:acetyl-CoA acetyltransferase